MICFKKFQPQSVRCINFIQLLVFFEALFSSSYLLNFLSSLVAAAGRVEFSVVKKLEIGRLTG